MSAKKKLSFQQRKFVINTKKTINYVEEKNVNIEHHTFYTFI